MANRRVKVHAALRDATKHSGEGTAAKISEDFAQKEKLSALGAKTF